MSGPTSPDRHLLFGGLAVQMGFISRDQLLEALGAWGRDGAPSLADWLRGRGWLSPDSSAALDRLVERHLARAVGEAPAPTILTAPPTPAIDSNPPTALLDAMPPPPSSAKVSRYHPVREHARGGLGEVYLALDSELDREVALKEIQPHYAYQPQARERFVREAQITGRLEHPGVVPVYGLGSYGDGRPYYAMRFIRGESLHDAITRFHDAPARPREWELGLRQLLTRFVAVCNAVGYAHSRGVIHRDIKPANVMLGDFGETLVVDWGLAKVLDQPEVITTATGGPPASAGATPTAVGEIVGTPAYMAPEQARGDIAHVDHRSDVFALGAMLYHLLTARPPYQGDIVAVLADAAEAGAAPARRINPRVPTALSAVCAKAMAVHPEGRYASAKALAEEVERFLADEPVSAYRDPLTVRSARWARRHRVLVSSLAVLLLASVVGLAAGLFAVGREQARTAAALGQSRVNETKARASEQRALRAEAEAKENLGRAEANLKLAKKAVDDCFGIAKDEPALQGEGLRTVRQLLFAKARPFYEQFRVRGHDDPATRAEMAEQLFHLAYIENQIGNKEQALRLYEQVQELRAWLTKEHPDDAAHRRGLADAQHNRGGVLKALGRPKAALVAYRQARETYASLAAAHPASVTDRGRLAAAHTNIGTLLRSLGDQGEAMKHHRQARALFEQLVKAHPEEAEHQRGLAGADHNIGYALHEQGDLAAALRAYQRARSAFARLAAEGGASTRRDDLAMARHNEGRALQDLGQRREALAAFEAAGKLRRALTELHPNVPAYRGSLGLTLGHLGMVLLDLGRAGEATAAFVQARDLAAALSAGHPEVTEYRRRLASAYTNLGSALLRQGRAGEALRSLQEAQRVGTALVKAHPDTPAYRSELAAGHYNLARAQQDTDRRDASLASLAAAIRLVEQLHTEGRRNARTEYVLLHSHYNRAILLSARRPREALADWDRTVALAAGAVKQRARLRRAEVLARAGEHARAAREARVLSGSTTLGPGDHYDLARVFALSAAAAARDNAVPLPVRERLAEAYARRAVGLLNEAKAAGHFHDRRHRADLDRDPDLDGLRGRADFRALLAPATPDE